MKWKSIIIALTACAFLIVPILNTGGKELMKVEKIKIYDAIKDKIVEVDSVSRSEEAWKNELSHERYTVTRKKITEKPYSSSLIDNKEKGIYVCAACGTHLFSSEAKFNSSTGWPSFYRSVSHLNIGTEDDYAHFMHRIEVHCARCRGHLGHVFNDGPEPTGKRYCINGIALEFIPLEQK